jgi:signal peptidase I
VALALCACGSIGSTAASPAQGIEASVSTYLTAVTHDDAVAACRVVTGRYWAAMANKIVAERADQTVPGVPAPALTGLPREPCRHGLARVLAHAPPRGTPLEFALSNVHARGATATAHLTMGAERPDGTAINMRFVKTPGGVWQIDCCTGAQLTRQPTATYRVPSEAMLPTLKVGQLVTVDNTVLRARPPRLGEIVVFNPPTGAAASLPRCRVRGEGARHRRMCGASTASAGAELFLKRVVGLPGDRLSLRGGHVIRNGSREPDGYITPCRPAWLRDCNFPQSIVVPAGAYFVLGDNRAVSDDSRFWGPVRRAWISGLVTR